MFRDTERVLKEVRMNFDPKQRLGELSVKSNAVRGNRQGGIRRLQGADFG